MGSWVRESDPSAPSELLSDVFLPFCQILVHITLSEKSSFIQKCRGKNSKVGYVAGRKGLYAVQHFAAVTWFLCGASSEIKVDLQTIQRQRNDFLPNLTHHTRVKKKKKRTMVSWVCSFYLFPSPFSPLLIPPASEAVM